MTPNLSEKAALVIKTAHDKSYMITTAESCTGGMIATVLTNEAGASKAFERGFVTYTNFAKHQQLGVPMVLLNTIGAVSKEVAVQMAEGALNHSPCHISIAVTGIAGPDGGTEEKPVGTVHIASKCMRNPTIHEEHHFSGDRSEIREATVLAALDLLLRQMNS